MSSRLEVINREETPEVFWGPADIAYWPVSRVIGTIPNPREFFAREARRLQARLGDLSDVRMFGANTLVAVWATKEERRTQGGLILHTTDKSKDEHVYQAKAGLLVKMGPHAFKSDENRTFLPEEVPAIGDWVLFRKGDGPMLEMWGQECMMLNDTMIRAILDRPDAVY